MGRVAGKKAFITGGAQGLGACFARMLADEGAKVYITDINGDGAAATAAAINDKHPGAAWAASTRLSTMPASALSAALKRRRTKTGAGLRRLTSIPFSSAHSSPCPI